MDTSNPNGAGTESAPAKPFDFADYDVGAAAEKGATYELRDPKSGLPNGVSFYVYGADAASYRRNLRRGQDAVAAAPEREPTDEDTAMLLGRARNAAAALYGWDGVYVAGEKIDFSYDSAVELFSKYFWAADQVLQFINYRGNF